MSEQINIQVRRQVLELSAFSAVYQSIYGRAEHLNVVRLYLQTALLLEKNGIPSARCTLYLNPYHLVEGKQALTIGHWEAIDDLSIAEALLDAILQVALDNDCQYLLGPMNGSTWNSYRFKIANDNRAYLLEPVTADYYPPQFEALGFRVENKYCTQIEYNISKVPEKPLQVEAYFKTKGLQIRNLDKTRIKDELTRIGALSLEAFAENVLYSPIALEDFVGRYMAMEQFLDPRFVFLAEDQEGQLEGYVFAYPDHLDPKQETIIVKTLARRTGSPFRGLGSILAAKVYEASLQFGFKNILHALMMVDNQSVNISKRFRGTDYRTYHLYSRSVHE